MSTDQFGSGGGFSSMFGAFKDQEDDIAHYFEVAPQLPPAGIFNKTGRATPDVAALGEGFQVITGGHTQPVGGTSASAPTFAAVISLLNEARLSNGKPALGYLNPWLYGNPAMLTDIVKGNAIGRGQFDLPYGFNCTKGYDQFLAWEPRTSKDVGVCHEAVSRNAEKLIAYVYHDASPATLAWCKLVTKEGIKLFFVY